MDLVLLMSENMKMGNCKTGTKEEIDNFIEDAKKWFKTTGSRFSDSKMVSVVSVAEYMANQKGLTLFKPDKNEQEESNIIAFPVDEVKNGTFK